MAFDGFDPARDAVWMAEVGHEATQVWSTKPRIAVFLAAMRHARDALRAREVTVHYRAMDEHEAPTLEAALAADLARLQPEAVIAVTPGEWRLARRCRRPAARPACAGSSATTRTSLASREDFARWAKGRKEYRMEYFYREMRRQHDVLMDGDAPVGASGTSTTTTARPSMRMGRVFSPRRCASSPMRPRAR